MSSPLFFIAFSAIAFINSVQGQECRDRNDNCRDWITTQASLCKSSDYIIKICLKSCGFCREKILPKFDASLIPPHLQPIAWLIGIWRSEHGGKAIFPTIPKFTYGEQLEISLSDEHMTGLKALNYTAFAWDITNHEELHSEYGYITIKPGTKIVALTTVMNNGIVEPSRIIIHLKDIGRISFSRDLPVLDLAREWTLLDSNYLQARLKMKTLTHGMQEHTFIRYQRIYP